MQIEILGIKIDDLDKKAAMELIKERLEKDLKTFIATPNPEMLTLSGKDKNFKGILNSADIKIPDGYGLKIGAKILGKKLNARLAGTDLMEELCGFAAKRGLGTYLLGGWRDTARITAENLKKKYVDLKICGAESGGKMEAWDNRVIIEHINAVKPEILFVALGHGRQEKWIFENSNKLPTVKVAMGVGGAFDFFSGRVRRAPMIMRKAGLEWLWRLIKEPYRYKRIWTAVVIFPMHCLAKKLKPRQRAGI